MISYLKGKVKFCGFGMYIIDVGGVGYKVYTCPQIKISDDIVDTQKDVELFVYNHIRDDISDLYGFLSYQELDFFELLLSVSGVGPKAGLNIMASGTINEIVEAITFDNLAFFTAISGIGKKAAARIILELKSKLSTDKSINILSESKELAEITEGLISLGYKRADILPYLSIIPSDLKETDQKMKWLLKNLSKV